MIVYVALDSKCPFTPIIAICVIEELYFLLKYS